MAKAKTHPAETTPIQELTIQGFTFTIPAPYAAGEVTLSEAEAATLNQTYAENIRNNFAKKVKAANEAGAADPTELQAALDEYAASYTFNGPRRSIAVPVDPVLREATKIARSMITEALQRKAIKIKDLPEGKLDILISNLLEKNSDIHAEARRRVEATKDATSSILDDLEDLAA